MEFLKKYRSELFIALLAFLIVYATGIFFANKLIEERRSAFSRYTIKENIKILQTSILNLNNGADIIYRLTLARPKILRLLAEATTKEKEQLVRKELRQRLEDSYKILQYYGVRQLHFYLPDGRSLLRFHKPNTYGDNLKQQYSSVRLTQERGAVVRGFEIRKYYNGFRNIYPLYFNKRFVGSVEISYSLAAIVNIIVKQNMTHFFGLLLKKEAVDPVIVKSSKRHYLPALLDKRYYWDNKVFEDLYYSINKKRFLQGLRTIEKDIASKIKDKLDSNKDFLCTSKFIQNNFLITFHPLKNIDGKYVGYIVTFQKSDFIASLWKHKEEVLLFIALLALTLSTLLFFYLKNQHDIKELLKQTSDYDPLTSLLNRRGFLAAFRPRQKLYERKQQPYGILFLDIDFFKKVNDTYGHDIGDLVLKQLAKILRSQLRSSDLVARWGGEEFIVVVGESDKEAVLKVAEKLRKAVEEFSEKNLPKFTISIGLAMADGNKDFDTLLKEADEALYKAKESGRNRVVIYKA